MKKNRQVLCYIFFNDKMTADELLPAAAIKFLRKNSSGVIHEDKACIITANERGIEVEFRRGVKLQKAVDYMRPLLSLQMEIPELVIRWDVVERWNGGLFNGRCQVIGLDKDIFFSCRLKNAKAIQRTSGIAIKVKEQ